MRLATILTPLCALSCLAAPALQAQPALQVAALSPAATSPAAQAAQAAGDAALLEMRAAFTAKDTTRLSRLLPAVQGHPLEGWAAYWELTARLREAQRPEVDAFLARWRGTYYEDRLRNDWLLLLGQRRAWSEFAHYHQGFRMQDDAQVQCYSLLIDDIQGQSLPDLPEHLLSLWWGQRNADDGCTHAVSELYADGRIKADQIWQRARIGAHNNRPAVVRSAVQIVAPQSLAHVANAMDKSSAFLNNKATETDPARRALVPLALARLASNDFADAAARMEARWSAKLTPAERDWVWGAIGRWAGIRLSPSAAGYFAKVGDDGNLLDEQLQWKVRTALRAGNWTAVGKAIDAMSPEGQRESAWVYWRARALLAGQDAAGHATAERMLQGIAGLTGFYEQMAYHWLGGKVAVLPEPDPLSEDEKARARTNPALLRGIYAIQAGLRSEGVREWNYATNLHEAGGMSDRELLAAADLACQHEVWDRCINTSERTRSVTSFAQRYPMPFREAVVQRSEEIALDPAYVYGLIRQESRFIMDARSSVGASGLMQIMPATARWTAGKIGLTDFKPGDINDKQTNIAIGTAYLKLALDEFAGSMPLAAAAYNAGPGRPRNWRNGPTLDAAIWAENIPFNETRDYVQKVLANATVYGAILSGQPQSLQARLGSTIGPRSAADPVAVADLP